MFQLARTCRPRRAGEWTEAKAVTFIVTLAASRSVTLAATRAGMSRKAAYSLKRRDASFAAAWNAAIGATKEPAQNSFQEPALNLIQGDKGDETHNPRFKRGEGNTHWPVPASDWYFETLARWRGESVAAASSLLRSNGEGDRSAKPNGGGAATLQCVAPPPRNLRCAVPLPTGCAGREDAVAREAALP